MEPERCGWGRKGGSIESQNTLRWGKVRPGLSQEALCTEERWLFFGLSICLDSSNCPRVHHAENRIK